MQQHEVLPWQRCNHCMALANSCARQRVVQQDLLRQDCVRSDLRQDLAVL